MVHGTAPGAQCEFHAQQINMHGFRNLSELDVQDTLWR